MDFFHPERELCLLFKQKNEGIGVSINYSITNSSVNICIFHEEGNQNAEQGRKNLNRLWKNFNLAFIGY